MSEIVTLSSRSVQDLIAWGIASIEQAGSFEQVREIAATADALKAYQRSIGSAQDALTWRSRARLCENVWRRGCCFPLPKTEGRNRRGVGMISVVTIALAWPAVILILLCLWNLDVLRPR